MFACGRCGKTHLMKEQAKYCCAKVHCECGGTMPAYRTLCLTCQINESNRVRREKLAKFPRTPAEHYAGPVFWVEADRFCENVSEAVETVRDERGLSEARVQTLQTCTETHLVLCADDILEAALEAGEHHEGADISEDARAALKKVIDEWNREFESEVTTWWPADTVLVIPEDWWSL